MKGLGRILFNQGMIDQAQVEPKEGALPALHAPALCDFQFYLYRQKYRMWGSTKRRGKTPARAFRFFLKKIDSGEIDMNLCGSLANHENCNVYDETPPQGLSETRRAGSFF